MRARPLYIPPFSAMRFLLACLFRPLRECRCQCAWTEKERKGEKKKREEKEKSEMHSSPYPRENVSGSQQTTRQTEGRQGK